MIVQEEEVMDRFAGQMSLCNFGALIDSCPDGPNCVGPGGTNYKDAGRVYDYNSWVTRNFVRDSLKQLFPDKADIIHESIDPGEYGLENYWVRFVCVFVFMMSVMSDLRSTMDMAYIIYSVPTEEGMWVEYCVPTWASKEKIKEFQEKSELDFVRFKIAGMPRPWKIFNVVAVIIPKLWIWKTTAQNGVMFLMETAGIEDVIVNVTALTFILNLDEMLFANFSHRASHHILETLEPYSAELEEEVEAKEQQSNDDAFLTLQRDRRFKFADLNLLPFRLFLNGVVTAIFVFEYYYGHCMVSESGGQISKPMSLPNSQVYPLLSFFFYPFVGTDEQEQSYWSMPPAG